MSVTNTDPHPAVIQWGPSAFRGAVNSKYLFRMRLVKYAGPRHYKSFSWGPRDQTSWYLHSMPLYLCALGGPHARCRPRDDRAKKKETWRRLRSPLSLFQQKFIPHTVNWSRMGLRLIRSRAVQKIYVRRLLFLNLVLNLICSFYIQFMIFIIAIFEF